MPYDLTKGIRDRDFRGLRGRDCYQIMYKIKMALHTFRDATSVFGFCWRFYKKFMKIIQISLTMCIIYGKILLRWGGRWFFRNMEKSFPENRIGGWSEWRKM